MNIRGSLQTMLLAIMAALLLASCQTGRGLSFTNHCERAVDVLPYHEYPDELGFSGDPPWTALAVGETDGDYGLSSSTGSFDLVVRDRQTTEVISVTRISFRDDLLLDGSDEHAGGHWTIELATNPECAPVLPQAPDAPESLFVQSLRVVSGLAFIAVWILTGDLLIRLVDSVTSKRHNHA